MLGRAGGVAQWRSVTVRASRTGAALWVALALALLFASGWAASPAWPGQQSIAQIVGRVHVPGWTPAGAPRLLTGDAIFEYMDGAGEIPKACGYRALLVRRYAHPSLGHLTLELYDMGSSSDAFGLYSMKRTPTSHFVQLDHRAALDQGQLVFWKGPYAAILYFEAPQQRADAHLLAFARALSRAISQRGAPPDLLRYLPRRGYVQNSARFFRGKAALDIIHFVPEDIFGLRTGAEMVVGTYSTPPGIILVARYPDGQAAQRALRAIYRSSSGAQAVGRGRIVGAAWATSPSARGRLLRMASSALLRPGPPWPDG